MNEPLSQQQLATLGEQIAEHAVHLDAAMHRLLTDLRRFDEGGGWYAQGFASCAQWLSWRVSWSPATSREHLRVARALAALPTLDAALAAGRLSYSKLRALTRVATPQTEELLLRCAEYSTASQLETLCRKFQTTQRGAQDVEPPRYVTARPTSSGAVCVRAMLRPEEAALLMQVIQHAARACGDGATRADGLMAVLEACARGDRPERSAVELILTAPAETLRAAPPVKPAASVEPAPVEPAPVEPAASVEPAHLPELDDYLPPDAARRLACDCGVVHAAVDAHGQPLSVGRRTRTIPAALKRALLLRDRHCRFPGCNHRLFLDGHHLKHWADGGDTSLDNLALLCATHHTFVHERGYRVEPTDDGDLRFLDPRGRPIPTVPPRPAPARLGWPSLRAANDDANPGAPLTADTGRSRWNGERVDYPLVVSYLCQRASSAAAASLAS